MEYADELKIFMIFSDGDYSKTYRTIDPLVKPCLSDSTVQKVLKDFLDKHKKTEGMLLIWGRGVIQHNKIIDARKIPKRNPRSGHVRNESM